MSVRGVMKVVGADTSTQENQAGTNQQGQQTSSGPNIVTKTSFDTPDPIINETVPQIKTEQSGFNKDVREASNQAISDYEKFYNDVLGLNRNELDEKYGQQFAKEGRYGNLNNKDFDETLRLSRQADAYNNKPIAKMHLGLSYNPSAGQGVGGFETTGYDRPKLETQEMRQMRANERLDETQRGLDIQLQHDITKLPYEYFKKTMDEKYNIRMNEAEAKRTMAQLSHVAAMNQAIMKNTKDFNARYNAKFGLKLGPIIAELAKTNSIQAMVFTNYVLGYPALPAEDVYTYEFLDSIINPAVADIKNRIARGEITREEGLRMFNDLTSALNRMHVKISKDQVDSLENELKR